MRVTAFMTQNSFSPLLGFPVPAGVGYSSTVYVAFGCTTGTTNLILSLGIIICKIPNCAMKELEGISSVQYRLAIIHFVFGSFYFCRTTHLRGKKMVLYFRARFDNVFLLRSPISPTGYQVCVQQPLISLSRIQDLDSHRLNTTLSDLTSLTSLL